MKESRIFNILFPFLIIGTTIVVILFSRGWRLNLQEQTVITTGILDVTSDPKGATVYINGEKRGKTPTVIDSLLPGKYQLELRKDLYTSWTKEIEIEEEYVTKIVSNLFEEKKELTQLSETPVDKIVFSESSSEAIVVNTHNGDQGVWKTQLNQSFFQLEKSRLKIADLVEAGKFDLLTSNYKIFPNNNFTKAILQIDVEGNPRRLFLLDLLKENAEIVEITEYFTFTDNYNWMRDNKTIAIETQESLLETFDTQNATLSIISKWPVISWSSSKDGIYFINKNVLTEQRSLFLSKIDGSDRKEIILDDSVKISEVTSIHYNEEYMTLAISSENNTNLFSLKGQTANLLYESELIWISTSPNERFFLFTKKDGTANFVYDFEEEKLISFNSSTQSNLANLSWTPNSLKLFYRYTNDKNENKVVSMDYDGTNFLELLNTPNFNGTLDHEFGFSSDSKEMYLPLPVSAEENTASWEEYVFKLQLR